MQKFDVSENIEQAITKIDRADVVIRSTIDRFHLGDTDLTKEQVRTIGIGHEEMAKLLFIALDYVSEAQGILENVNNTISI